MNNIKIVQFCCLFFSIFFKIRIRDLYRTPLFVLKRCRAVMICRKSFEEQISKLLKVRRQTRSGTTRPIDILLFSIRSIRLCRAAAFDRFLLIDKGRRKWYNITYWRRRPNVSRRKNEATSVQYDVNAMGTYGVMTAGHRSYKTQCGPQAVRTITTSRRSSRINASARLAVRPVCKRGRRRCVTVIVVVVVVIIGRFGFLRVAGEK